MSRHATPHADVALSLSMALVASSSAPILLLDGGLTILAASESFCQEFLTDPADVVGREVFAVGNGEWNAPRLRSLLKTTLSDGPKIDTYEMDLKVDHEVPRRLVIKAKKLAYEDIEQVRVVLGIFDITAARAAEKLKDDLIREKDDLLHDKVILLKELHHRVANSLQIIASVLMMSARKVQSEETRGHLHDAHNRVMSIAAVQQQLTSSGVGEINLRSYLTQLCESLGASMIHDPRQIKLAVNVDETAVDADVSVSLGLIVTELVINGLKHAFPGDRIGKITVAYRSSERNWTLSVTDNGVGMPANPESKPAGLGSSLVDALAKKLKATIQVADARPGTAVSITQTRAMAVGGKVAPSLKAV